jgi:phosphate:Na+ symporter
VTAVIQSSAAVIVLAVGFVNAGLMTLPQALGIIYGANIGTTHHRSIDAFEYRTICFANHLRRRRYQLRCQK